MNWTYVVSVRVVGIATLRVGVRRPDRVSLALRTPAPQIAEADDARPRNPFTVHKLPSSHSPFASMSDAIAEILANG